MHDTLRRILSVLSDPARRDQAVDRAERREWQLVRLGTYDIDRALAEPGSEPERIAGEHIRELEQQLGIKTP